MNWHDVRQRLWDGNNRLRQASRAFCEDHVHRVETYTPHFLLDDLKAAAAGLRERLWTAFFGRLPVLHVSVQWVEQHERDSVKHGSIG